MSKLISVLFSPGATFQKLREKGGFILPLITLSLISLLIVWINMPLVEKESLAKLTEQTQPLQADTLLLIGKITGYVGAAFSVVIIAFLVGLLLMFINMLINGEAKYMQLVKVALYSSIPTMISGLLTAIMLRVTNAQSVKDVSLSAAALLSERKGILFSFLNLLNPFSIWGMVLMIIGTTVMTGRPASRVIPFILIGWIIMGMLLV